MRLRVVASAMIVLAACGGEPDVSADGAVVVPFDAGIDAPQLPPPDVVLASDGASTDHVSVQWTAVPGALLYYVYRDGVRIAITDETSYLDVDAEPGGLPGPPAFVTGSEDLFDRVHVTWGAPEPGNVVNHGYVVRAFNDAGPGMFGLPEFGYRAAFPVIELELEIDFDGVRIPVGLANVYDDLDAPPAGLFVGNTFASQGTSQVIVSLSVSAGPELHFRQYAVRARNAAGYSNDQFGFGVRTIGTMSFQWQRSAADADADYSDLPGGNAQVFTDNTAPANGEGRYYRCRITAPGFGTVFSNPRRGFRAPTP
jgi:hypothetical protein